MQLRFDGWQLLFAKVERRSDFRCGRGGSCGHSLHLSHDRFAHNWCQAQLPLLCCLLHLLANGEGLRGDDRRRIRLLALLLRVGVTVRG